MRNRHQTRGENVSAISRYGGLVLVASSLVLAGLLWLLPINEYEVHACDPDGVAISGMFLFGGILLITGAAVFAFLDRKASHRRRRILLGICAAIFALHLARGPEILREHEWTNARCDVGPMGKPDP
jgi:hypothetical protein